MLSSLFVPCQEDEGNYPQGALVRWTPLFFEGVAAHAATLLDLFDTGKSASSP
jgi:hypothetical protein